MLLRSRCITSALNWKRAMQPGPDPLCPVIVSDKRAMGISPLGPGARSSVLWQRVNDKRALEIDSRGRYVHQTDPLEKSRNVFFFFSFFVPPPPPPFSFSFFLSFLFLFFSFFFSFFLARLQIHAVFFFSSLCLALFRVGNDGTRCVGARKNQ